MEGFPYNEKGSIAAKAAWAAAFSDQRIGSVGELIDEFLCYIARVFVFCPQKFEQALITQGLMSETESINDAVARFPADKQQVIERFLNPDWIID
jgi:hypothetical protein